jgi:hypothetical protein
MFTFLLSGREEQEPLIWIFWIITFLAIRETIESMAIRDILLRLKTERSDPDATGQSHLRSKTFDNHLNG